MLSCIYWTCCSTNKEVEFTLPLCHGQRTICLKEGYNPNAILPAIKHVIYDKNFHFQYHIRKTAKDYTSFFNPGQCTVALLGQQISPCLLSKRRYSSRFHYNSQSPSASPSLESMCLVNANLDIMSLKTALYDVSSIKKARYSLQVLACCLHHNLVT